MVKGRDYFVDEVLKDFAGKRVDPVPWTRRRPLFLMYTSGTTGKPKGCQHRTGGYLAYVTGTSKYIQDIHPEDVYWCMADIGWITGHSYIVYGPLALAATSVIYEGVPTYPDAGRPWRIAERLNVNIFHTSPTAIRMLRKAGPDEPKKYNYHFKHMTTVGEPIEPTVWRWYYDAVGKGEAVIVDTWWQTENGGFLCSTKPALGSHEAGQRRAGRAGHLSDHLRRGRQRAHRPVLARPATSASGILGRASCRRSGATPTASSSSTTQGTARTRNSKDWRDWPYFADDGAVLAADGYFRILGRVDDVINVAGHRPGNQGARVGVPHGSEKWRKRRLYPSRTRSRASVPEVYVSLKPGFAAKQGDREQGHRGDGNPHRQDRAARRTCTSCRICRRRDPAN